MKKTYSELIRIPTFEERYQYLRLCGKVAEETFGFKRWLNQEFYHSDEWIRFRNKIIIRDNGCDLALEGFEIFGSIIIHHINPITYEDILNRNPCVFDETTLCLQNFQPTTQFTMETKLQSPIFQLNEQKTIPVHGGIKEETNYGI